MRTHRKRQWKLNDGVEKEKVGASAQRDRDGWMDRMAASTHRRVHAGTALEGGATGARGEDAEEGVPAPLAGGGMIGIVERATAVLPVLAALALAPGVALANHSCLPNCQVESSHVAIKDNDDSGECGSLRIELVALRDISPGEELTVAYIPVSQPVLARRNELATRHGFRCDCPRCVTEDVDSFDLVPSDVRLGGTTHRGQPPSLTATELLRLADQAQEEGRYGDAEGAARAALAMDPADGNAAHKVGTALLGKGEWAAAHRVWRLGVAMAPAHPALSQQAAKDSAYLPGIPTSPDPSHGPPPPFTELHRAGVWSTAAPLLSVGECREWVAAAEAAGAALGGWTTSRHYAVPTTDIPVHAIPSLLPKWNSLMRDKLAPLLAAACPEEVSGPACVRVHDAFVVRYSAAAQHHLPTHADQSLLSVTLALNGLDEYEGGGTVFAELRGPGQRQALVAQPGVGHAVAFKGQLQHGGAPVTAGVRYIVAAFLFVE